MIYFISKFMILFNYIYDMFHTRLQDGDMKKVTDSITDATKVIVNMLKERGEV